MSGLTPGPGNAPAARPPDGAGPDLVATARLIAELTERLARTEARLAEQDLRLTTQDAELARLRRRRDEPSDPLASPTGPPLPVVAGPSTDDRPDRRALLRRVGAAAAGAVTGGAAIAAIGAGPAAAANGDPLTVGATTTGSATTALGWIGATPTGTGPAMLLVKDSNAGVLNNRGATVLALRGSTDGSAVLAHHYGSGGAGVYALGDTGALAVGSADGYGLRAQGGTALYADANFGGGISLDAYAGRAHAVLRPGPFNPTTSAYARLQGEIVCDNTGQLWLCTVAGTPGTWRKLGGPGTAGQLHVLPSPKRIFDSRPGSGPDNVAKGVFVDQAKAIDAKNAGTGVPSGVPAGATALLANFAVTETVNGGYGALWAYGAPDPGTANLNWNATATSISNLAVSGLDGTATFTAKVAGTAHVVLDVIGYWR